MPTNAEHEWTETCRRLLRQAIDAACAEQSMTKGEVAEALGLATQQSLSNGVKQMSFGWDRMVSIADLACLSDDDRVDLLYAWTRRKIERDPASRAFVLSLEEVLGPLNKKEERALKAIIVKRYNGTQSLGRGGRSTRASRTESRARP